MLKTISESGILKLLNYFDTYLLNHGRDPLYLHMHPDVLRGIFFKVVPPIHELTNDRVRAQLLKWVTTKNISDLIAVFNSEISMNARSSNMSDFTEDLFMKYKSDFMLFWVVRDRHVQNLPHDELLAHQKDCFVKGCLPIVFQQRFKTLSKRVANLEELLSVFDSVVAYFKSSMSSGSGSKKSKNTSYAGGASAKAAVTSSPAAPPAAVSAAAVSPTPNGRQPAQPFGYNQKKSVKKVKKAHIPPPLSSDDDDEVCLPGILDSGSSTHTVPSSSYLTTPALSIGLSDETLIAANDTMISVIGKGDAILSPNLTLNNALITPSINQPIVSPQLIIQDTNASILLSDSSAYLVSKSVANDVSISNLINQSTCIATLDPLDNLYKTSIIAPNINITSPAKSVTTVRRYATAVFKTIA